MKKNYKGDVINGIKKLIRPEYGTGEYNNYGEPIVDWSKLSEYADDDGFDKRNLESNGNYKITIKLPIGTKLIRFGNETGTFTAPIGTPYETLALPYIQETVEYHEYKVISDNLTVECEVCKGVVAPGFGSQGGGIQYKHSITISASLKQNILERINT